MPLSLGAAVTATASSSPGWLTSAILAALVSAAVAIATVAWNGRRNRLDRQRQLFAEALGAVMAYREYVFIVRRRPSDDAETRHAITSDLSRTQAQLNTFRGQLLIEAPRVGHSYEELASATRRIVGPLIHDAWNTPPITRDSQVHAPDVDYSPLAAYDAGYLSAVADHLSVIWAPLHARLRRRPVEASPHPAPSANTSRTGAGLTHGGGGNDDHDHQLHHATTKLEARIGSSSADDYGDATGAR